MNLPIEKLVMFMIFLVVLIAVLYVAGIIQPFGGLNTESQLRFCCINYKANNCTQSSYSELICDGKSLQSLASELNFGKSEVDDFCGC